MAHDAACSAAISLVCTHCSPNRDRYLQREQIQNIIEGMDQQRIEAALAAAPAWAKIGMTMPSEKMRERSLQELAACIADCLDRPVQHIDRRQLTLPL